MVIMPGLLRVAVVAPANRPCLCFRGFRRRRLLRTTSHSAPSALGSSFQTARRAASRLTATALSLPLHSVVCVNRAERHSSNSRVVCDFCVGRLLPQGSSAGISTEAAITSVRRSMAGFMGPRDIFRNPEAIFRLFEGPGQMLAKVGGAAPNLSKAHASPFELVLSTGGDDFAVMGMHFKLGLYEHQSAGALQGLIALLHESPEIKASPDNIAKITITAYEPAYGIIGDPAKMDPKTRQSADHSMAYIVSTLLRKALQGADADWRSLMLSPYDYSREAIFDPLTRSLMQKIEFNHGASSAVARRSARRHHGV